MMPYKPYQGILHQRVRRVYVDERHSIAWPTNNRTQRLGRPRDTEHWHIMFTCLKVGKAMGSKSNMRCVKEK